VISGTGRARTTYLVQLLTEVGLNTAADRLRYSRKARAGLEYDVRRADAPYIVKSPAFSQIVDEVLADPNICIERVIIPVRDLKAASDSRIRVQQRKTAGLPDPNVVVAGGLWGTMNPGRQPAVLARHFHHLVQRLVAHDIPITFLAFDRMNDAQYLFDRLAPILTGVSIERLSSAIDKIFKPEP
jgi:hypothetical protein